MAQLDTAPRDLIPEGARKEFPLIPLRDTVVFPRIALPIVVRREKSRKALEDAMRKGHIAVFVAQRDDGITDPVAADLFTVATAAKVREMVKQEDGSVRLVVEGLARVRIAAIGQMDPYPRASVEAFLEPQVKKTERIEALMYSVMNQFRRVAAMGGNVPFDVSLVVMSVSDPWLLGDLIAANIEMNVDEKQSILEAATVEDKLDRVAKALARQVKVLEMASKIQADTGRELDKMQREVFLREQMKSIEKELSAIGGKSESDELLDRLEKAGMPPEVMEQAMKEYERLKAMPSFSPELSYLRTYLEWLCDLPWSVVDKSTIDVRQAKRILDEDHYGLEKVKERIIEYLAVQKLAGKMRGSILCFAGPPGTGKTSIGKSIARALGRKFFRMSLGGIRDEAEIRGHRRTYVGALPGRIIQGIATAKTRNPVFMLDEIDKVGADFRGDPSAALLEALDPEQNSMFSDHYLEVPFDLSDVMFITTANLLDTVPPALRDRMEVIEFGSYTDEEKFHIARQHLVEKVRKATGLTAPQFSPTDSALRGIIRSYTREAGVRDLERKIAALGRKTARHVAEGKKSKSKLDAKDLSAMLGPARFTDATKEKKDGVGVVTGLAWTEAGGEILQVEATKMPGRGNLILTGNLGDVMQESARAAYSYVRSAVHDLGVKEPFHRSSDIHVHVPSGATPKDGPSAGVSMATAIASIVSGRKVRRDVAMTGEISLRGRVLEIGGVKEKVLAAYRTGITTVIIPKENEKDLVDVPAEVRKAVTFIPVTTIAEVFAAAFVPARHRKPSV